MKGAARTAAVLLVALLATAAPRKKRIAVLDFEYGTVRSEVAGMFGTDVDVGRGIADLLVKNLVLDGTYRIIERRMLNTVLNEQDFTNDGRVNPAHAIRLGKLLGAEIVVMGSITQFGGEMSKKSAGGGAVAAAGGGFGSFSKKKTKAIVAIDARLVEIETGEIVAVADGMGQSSREGKSLLGGGFGTGGLGMVAVDFSTTAFRETLLGEAVQEAVKRLSARVSDANDSLPVRLRTVEGLLAFVREDKAVINIGAKAGLEPGVRLTVERITEEVKDPVSGALIRRLTEKSGELEVLDVDEVSAVCRVVSNAGMKTGDLVKGTVH